ncbi:16589_t:CDS:1, partial [Racocetra fulgida]
IDLNRRQGNFTLGAPCSNDTECETSVCRRVDQDGRKCQQTDTRPKGDTCLVEEACNGTLICSFNDTKGTGPKLCCNLEFTLDCEP